MLVVTGRALDVGLTVSGSYQRRRVAINVVEVISQGIGGIPGDPAVGDRTRPVTGDGGASNGGGVGEIRDVNGMAVGEAETLVQPRWCGVYPVNGFDSVSGHALNGYGSVMARETSCRAVQLIGIGARAGPVSEAGGVRWCRERIAGLRCVSLIDEVAAPQNYLASAGIGTAIAKSSAVRSVAGGAAMTVNVVSAEDIIRNREPLGHRCPGTSDGEDQCEH
jgi:hypothetical protein